jgi:hypothetical protein
MQHEMPWNEGVIERLVIHVNVGTTNDLDAARAHMVERQKPVFARVDLEGDVI